MKRTVVTPPNLGPAALAELKHWLAITNAQDDASLEALLRSAIETCEAFTGQLPLTATIEELHDGCSEWQGLFASPVQAITALELAPADGSRSALPSSDYEFDIDSERRGLFRLRLAGQMSRVAVRCVAGIADSWEDLPDGLRHGVLRLAAHHYRSRESDMAASPPAAIAALWRPWRRMRLT